MNIPQGNDSWGTRPRASLRPRDGTIPVVGSSQQQSTVHSTDSIASPDVVDMDTMMRSKDIDAGDAKNPLTAAQFVKYLYAHYKRIEHKSQVNPDYMSRQNDINDKMRSILVDWLVDVHLKFKLAPETLFLTVNIIDRFLEVKQVSRKHLQLVGVTAMLIASKYEEIWAPEVRDFVYISDRAYNRDQILNMEKIMLNALRFNLSLPTQYHFLHRFIKAADIAHDKMAVNYATYLVELTLPEYSCLHFPPSLVAAAAVCGACNACNFNGMRVHPQLIVHSGHSESDIKRCVKALDALYTKAPISSLVAVFKKFSSERFDNVASHTHTPGANWQ